MVVAAMAGAALVVATIARNARTGSDSPPPGPSPARAAAPRPAAIVPPVVVEAMASSPRRETALPRVVAASAGGLAVAMAWDGGRDRLYGVGDAVAPGVRLAAIGPDGLWLQRGSRLEHVDGATGNALPAAVQPAPEPDVIMASAGRPHPASSRIERQIAGYRR